MGNKFETELGNERLLKEANASYESMAAIFKQAPAFMCILRGPDHTFELVNDRYLQLIGQREVLGLPVRHALPEIERQGFFELLDYVYQSGETFSGTDMTVLLHRSGDKQIEKRFLDFVYIALKNTEGEVTGILVHGIDQTERKLSEMILAEREEQLRLALDAADVGLWDVDVVNETLYWPPRVKAMFGISPDKPVSMKDYYEGLHHDDIEATVTSYQNATDPNIRSQYDAEYRTIGKEDDVIRWVAARGRGIFNEANQCVRVIGTALDITQRKANEEALRKSEEQLRETDRRKDEFLAMLAHELRNPLAPISAAAQLLQIAKLDEVQVRRTSQIISRQVKHMTGLVDDLLDVSRVTRGLVELENSTIDINHVISDAVEQVTPLVRARSHHLALKITPEMPLVQGDRERLVQVVANILNNAAKYTPEGGHLLLQTEVHDGYVHIRIVDDGIGMTPELVTRAFDLFAQAERSSDRSSGGLGLGLALVKSLVELHHGKVICESAGLGKGTMFTVSLPLLPAEEKRTEEQAPNESSLLSIAPLRILVVDDNADAASVLGMLLEAEGHEVMIENGSHKALERAKIEAPQLCLLDIGLPEMDGNALARHLRALPQTAASLLVAITGYGQESDRKETSAAGFDYHLVKPIDPNELLSILAELDSRLG
jgi:PAS domain S-box-containing protein